MTAFFTDSTPQFEVELDAALVQASCTEFDALFAMPRCAADELASMDMCDLAMGGPACPKDAADELFKRLLARLEGDDVAIAALCALHLVHHENRLDQFKERNASYAN